MIDSHTHLDITPGDVSDIVAGARALGVTRILTIGTTPDSCVLARAAAQAHEEVWFAVGQHPNNTTGYSDSITDGLRAVAQHPRCLAIGETGLDYYRNYAPFADQARAFSAHIELARELGKPLIIHSRSADDDTIANLALEAAGLEVIIHCFSMPDRLEECLDNGWQISFAGNVTYPNARDLALAAERVPLDRILVETDAPFLTPQVVRKEKNQAAYVTHTALFIAERRGISYEEFESAVHENSARVLGW